MVETRQGRVRKARCSTQGKTLRKCRPKGVRSRAKQKSCTSGGRGLVKCRKDRK